MKIEQAFILAAGLGKRMRPLTNDRPKPMVQVDGKPIIDYAIESLRDAGIKNIVANTHYKAEVINDHLREKDVTVSHEASLLDTGGGIKRALQYFDVSKPLMILSGDSILVGSESVTDLTNAWNSASMDLLLLLQPLETMVLTPGVGDYDIVGGKPVRSLTQSGKYMWTSARILNPRLFDNTPDTPFSFLSIMDAAQQSGRLAAHIHKGIWHHLTTPDDILRVQAPGQPT